MMDCLHENDNREMACRVLTKASDNREMLKSVTDTFLAAEIYAISWPHLWERSGRFDRR